MEILRSAKLCRSLLENEREHFEVYDGARSNGPRQSVMRQGWRRLIVLALVGLGCLLVAQWRPLRTVLDLFRARPVDDAIDIAANWSYMWRMLNLLEVDPASGAWRFPHASEGAGPEESGLLAYHAGDFETAVAHFAEAGPERRFWLALATMRAAEESNCRHHLGHDVAGLCTLPIGRPHPDPTAAQAASRLFAELLEEDPDDPVLRWLSLFNLLVSEPSVGERELLALDTPFAGLFYGEAGKAVAAAHPRLVLREEGALRGVDVMHAGKGLAVEDFNGDGSLDVVTGGTFDPLQLFVNDGTGNFEELVDSGLSEANQAHIVTAADVDGDGWMDLFVGRPFQRYMLYRNREGRGFEDVTESWGLGGGPGVDELIRYTWVSAWADVDLDGDLDLFLAQWDLPVPGWMLGRGMEPSRLLLNDGGRFVDASEDYGVAGLVAGRQLQGACFGDLDGDGYPELFLSSPFPGQSLLLWNKRGSGLVEQPLPEPLAAGFMASFLDVDHDGTLDLLWGGFSSTRASTADAVFADGPGEGSGRTRVLLGTGKREPPFAGEMTFDHELPIATMGMSFGDLDNDGCVELYLGTGNPTGWMVLPNLLYASKREGSGCATELANVSMLHGVGNLQKGHGIVFFDIDGDGDEDIWSTLGGLWPADRWRDELFVNHGTVGAWVGIRLRGQRTNRFGLGARVRVFARGPEGEAVVRQAVMDNKTGFGSAPYLLRLGLGEAVEVEQIEVDWPVSGTTLRYEGELGSVLLLGEDGSEELLGTPAVANRRRR